MALLRALNTSPLALLVGLSLASCAQPPAECPTQPSEEAAVAETLPSGAAGRQASMDVALRSWNEGPTRSAIEDFVQRVTTEGSADYLPERERIAVFDNDGTLWIEKPIYVQLIFALDRVKAMAAAHPEWQSEEPFASVLSGDEARIAQLEVQQIMQLVLATHAGMSTDEYQEIVRDWLKTARHPRYGRPYTELVYQPMLELLSFLRAQHFKTYIVSGGGVEFMRVFAEEVYGIPPEQVIGSSVAASYKSEDGHPKIVKQAELFFIDDKAGKPVAINEHIGRIPTMAFGNSDGDFQMLEWTTSHDGPHFGAFVHHTNHEAEYTYDRDSHVGRLERGLDEAEERGWHLIDMKTDWKLVFAPAPH